MKDKSKKIFGNWFSKLKLIVKKIKKETGALYLASKRPDVPLYAKIIAVLVVGYALSPIDFIPDFIPVLGYLDDLILVPLGIYFAVKLIPQSIMNECREEAEELFNKGKPRNWIAGGIIITIWILIIVYILMKLM